MENKWPSILIGALAYALIAIAIAFLGLTGISAGAIGCLVILSSGLVAVWHYTSTNHLTIPLGSGAGIGALAGLVGALIGGAVSLLLVNAGILPDPMELARQQFIDQGMSEADMEQAMQMAESFSNPVIGLVIGTAFGALFGALGGLLGAVFFKHGEVDADLDNY